MIKADVLMVNGIGPAFTGDTVRKAGIGGSELEITQIAEALTSKGHAVVVANGVAEPCESYGVRYVPLVSLEESECRCLYIERGTVLHEVTSPIHADRIVIRATDIMCEFYEPHRAMLADGSALLVGVSQWQLRGFIEAIPAVRTLCIPPMLGDIPATEKVKGRFVYASAPCKGLDATLRKWCEMYRKYPQMRECHLLVALPGYATGEAPPLATYQADECRVEYVGTPTVEEFRKLIASAEGLFYVNEMTETFCCTAAFAEMSGTRTHIWCKNGLGGIPEAIADPSLLCEHEATFESAFIRALRTGMMADPFRNTRTPAALAGRWEEALGLSVPAEVQAIADQTQPTTMRMTAKSPEAAKFVRDLASWMQREGADSAHAKLREAGVDRLLATGEDKVPTPVPARADGKPTVGLVVIAKNENPIVARALGSCPWVDAVTVVVDASSTDGTAELCARLGAEVHVRPYMGSLAETRNDALRIAEQRTDYMLLVDADDVVDGERPETLDKDLYDLFIHDGNIRYPRGQLLRSRAGFRFVGCDKDCRMNIPHEYLTRPGAAHGGILPGLKYRRLGGIKGVSGWQDQAGFRAKYLKHARDLERHYLEHPEHTRTHFYLGQSYRDAGEPERALPWYRKRAAADRGEEAWFSQLRVAEIVYVLTNERGASGDPVEEWLKAYEMRPTRADPLVSLALFYRDDRRKQYERAYLYARAAAALPLPELECLFLSPDLYKWVSKTELALTAHYTGRHDEAVKVMRHVLTVCPEDQRAWGQETLSKMLAGKP